MSENLTLLGNKNTIYKDDYAPEVLETFDNKHLENDYFVKFNCPEFTSLCPITGQPDFATIYISYVPNKKMVESKSLKLYLFSGLLFNVGYICSTTQVWMSEDNLQGCFLFFHGVVLGIEIRASDFAVGHIYSPTFYLEFH